MYDVVATIDINLISKSQIATGFGIIPSSLRIIFKELVAIIEGVESGDFHPKHKCTCMQSGVHTEIKDCLICTSDL